MVSLVHTQTLNDLPGTNHQLRADIASIKVERNYHDGLVRVNPTYQSY